MPFEMQNPGLQAGASGELLVGCSPEINSPADRQGSVHSNVLRAAERHERRSLWLDRYPILKRDPEYMQETNKALVLLLVARETKAEADNHADF